jgi:hypothetical protein
VLAGFADILCRKLPAVSSIIYSWPFDMSAKEEVDGVTLHALYFSRTVVHSAPAPESSDERLRSPVLAIAVLPAVALFAADAELPSYVFTEAVPLAPGAVAATVERASVGGVALA